MTVVVIRKLSILKALKLAPEGRYYIVGADKIAECPQFASVDQALTLPPASDPGFVDAVLDVCHRLDIRAVFHGCEPHLLALSRAPLARSKLL